MTNDGLSTVVERDLLALLQAVERGELPSPISAAALQSRGFGHIATILAPYTTLGVEALRAVLTVALAERRAFHAPKLALVWTGDDPGVSHARHTRVLLPELFSQARKHVLVAGYAIDHGAEIFGALHRAMVAYGVSAELFVDVDQLYRRLQQHARSTGLDWLSRAASITSAKDNRARGRAVIELFLSWMWPFGEPRPAIYFDPRTAEGYGPVSLHAKCVIIDHTYSLITSANFTRRGQVRNFEAGVSIEDSTFANSLARQWHNLIDAGIVERA